MNRRSKPLILFASGMLLLLVTGCSRSLNAQILAGGAKASPPRTQTQKKFYGACSLSAAVAEDELPRLQLSRTIGNPVQDAAFNNILSGLNHYFEVNPAFFIFNDQSSSNAFATPQQFDPRYSDGSVAFGYFLFNSEIRETGPANFTVAAVMAHEFAHILQFKLGEHLETKLSELEADYMSGWYMGNASGMWLGQASTQALRSFFSKGDYAFNSATHHGTPQERISAVAAGLRDATSPLRSAFSNAHAYVTNLDIESK